MSVVAIDTKVDQDLEQSLKPTNVEQAKSVLAKRFNLGKLKVPLSVIISDTEYNKIMFLALFSLLQEDSTFPIRMLDLIVQVNMMGSYRNVVVGEDIVAVAVDEGAHAIGTPAEIKVMREEAFQREHLEGLNKGIINFFAMLNQECSKLVSLTLSGFIIQDFNSLISAAQKSSSLTSLNLSNSELTDEHGFTLANMLSTNRILLRLDIRDTSLSYSLAEIAKALLQNNTLTDIALGDALGLPEEDGWDKRKRFETVKVIADLLEKSRTILSMSITTRVFDNEYQGKNSMDLLFMKALGRNKALQKFVYVNDDAIDDKAMDALAKIENTTLNTLNIIGIEPSKLVGFAFCLRSFKSLSELYFSKSEIGDWDNNLGDKFNFAAIEAMGVAIRQHGNIRTVLNSDSQVMGDTTYSDIIDPLFLLIDSILQKNTYRFAVWALISVVGKFMTANAGHKFKESIFDLLPGILDCAEENLSKAKIDSRSIVEEDRKDVRDEVCCSKNGIISKPIFYKYSAKLAAPPHLVALANARSSAAAGCVAASSLSVTSAGTGGATSLAAAFGTAAARATTHFVGAAAAAATSLATTAHALVGNPNQSAAAIIFEPQNSAHDSSSQQPDHKSDSGNDKKGSVKRKFGG